MNKKLILFSITFIGLIVYGLFFKEGQSRYLTKELTQKSEISEKDKMTMLTKEQILNKISRSENVDKKDLISVIIEEKSSNNYDPHSVEAIRENKKGAMKVLALKKLVTSLNKQEQTSLLIEIIDRAKDPTISKIAASYLESLKQGRSFFKDFKTAIEDLPIPE